MDWREVGPEDLVECMEVEPRAWGDDALSRQAALEVLKKLARSLACNSAVVETGGSKKRKVGFGFSVFVTRQFADKEIESPKPGMNSRILASMRTSKPVVRPEMSLCETNEPLDVVIMCGSFKYELLSPQETIRAEMMMPAAFAEAHIGYRLNRILVETVTERHRQQLESSGVWRKVVEYEGDKGALMLLTKAEALAVSGSVAGPMFDYHEPVLRLRHAEKQLLAEALKGGTDKELSAKLNLSLPTVKKRWASLFERVARVRPDLLPNGERRESPESRGPQKRHRILAYVRAHPEEVRPYRWGKMLHS